MKTRFRKIALATAVSSALLGVSVPSQALVVGNAGEALLIPLVVFSGYTGPDGIADTNTIIEIEIPSAIGWEDVANIYTARNTTPTNANLSVTPDPDLAKTGEGAAKAKIHWFFFGPYSDHIIDGVLKVTANDVVQINWAELATDSMGGNPTILDGVAGYMVITDENSALDNKVGAKFSMFGDAWLVADSMGPGLEDFPWSAPIPVMAMTDGPDTDSPYPTVSNNVVMQSPFSTSGYGPSQVSPLLSGIRTTLADGDNVATLNKDFTVFDLKLSDRNFPTIHVIWNDTNLDNPLTADIEGGLLSALVFDSDENALSTTLPVFCELNVIWIDPPFAYPGPPWSPPPTWNDGPVGGYWGFGPLGYGSPCLTIAKVPTPNKSVSNGYISYTMPEYQDRGTYMPETSMTAFAIMFDQVGNDLMQNNTIAADTILAHDRGMFGHATPKP